MKKISFIATASMLMVVGCSQDILIDSPQPGNANSNAIEFGLSMTDAATKASKETGNSFVFGDAFSVDAFQYLGQDILPTFTDQTVTYDGSNWKYTPIKYWDEKSTYDFYAIYPSSVNHAFSAADRLYTVTDFTVANDPADQVDVMIAQQKTGVSPFNTVDYNFNHILSNVNFYMKAAKDLNMYKINSIEIVSFDIDGLKSKGSFTQTGWDANNVVVGSWDVDETSVYDFPEAKGQTTTTSLVTLSSDMLMMPQVIDEDATVNVTYKLNYADGSSMAFTRSAKFANVAGKKNKTEDVTIAKWESKNRYNYYLLVDPSKNEEGGNTGKPNGTITTDHNDTEHPATVDIITLPDTDGDGYPEYWVDEDRDGTPDYPLVWADPDGDGTENLYPDRDQNGQPDGTDTDGDGTPDDLWVDRDGDGECETEISRTPVIDNPDVDDPEDEEVPYIDYNGGVNEYKHAEAYKILGPDNKGEYWLDVDGNGTQDILIVWKDIDDDGKLEGIADRDGDCLPTENDNYDGDDVDYNGKGYQGGPQKFDVILVYDKTTDTWNELEKIVTPSGDEDIDVPEPPTQKKPNGSISGDHNDATHPNEVVIMTKDTDGDGEPDEYWVDEDLDGTPDYPLVWKDPDPTDDDPTEYLYPDHDNDGTPDFWDDEPGKDPEGNDWTGDTDGDGTPDNAWVDYSKPLDGEAETELSRRPTLPDPPVIPDNQVAIEFSATVEEWIDDYDANVDIKQQ